MSPADQPTPDILELVQHTLDELGVRDADGVAALFGRIEGEWQHDYLALSSTDHGTQEAYRVKWLGRKQGIVSLISDNWLRSAPGSLKRDVGVCLNTLRRGVEERIATVTKQPTVDHFFQPLSEPQRSRNLPTAVTATSGITEPVSGALDITLPGHIRPIGVRHPIRRAIQEITDIFRAIGFSVEEGPEIESVYYNFEALNIPEDHPSRDDQDTFYIDANTVLRTHTSPVQIRTMERQKPPLRIIVPGKVYRNETPDASHSCMFHQVEGLAVDTNITFADLKGTLDYFMKAYYGSEVRTRFRPSFFPFTEPSAEMDVSCIFCGGKGCRVCKGSGWLEMGGCGMVDPAVFAYVRYDASQYSGFAFGFGVERLAMLKYGVSDIQQFVQGDVRFLHQFR